MVEAEFIVSFWVGGVRMVIIRLLRLMEDLEF